MKIVLTGGKFNRIHPGHVWLLKKAKKLGYLLVVLAHDRHNKRDYASAARTRKKEIENLKAAHSRREAELENRITKLLAELEKILDVPYQLGVLEGTLKELEHE